MTSRRFIWFALIQLVIVAAIVGGWVFYWMSARGQVEADLDARLAAWGESGLKLDCAARRFSGFPLRFHISCEQMSLRVATGPHRIKASAPALSLTASAISPRYLRLAAQGVLKIDIERAKSDAGADSISRLSLLMRGRDKAIDVEQAEGRLKTLGLEFMQFRAAISTWRDQVPALSFDLSGDSLALGFLPRTEANAVGPARLDLPFTVKGKKLAFKTAPPLHRLADPAAIGRLAANGEITEAQGLYDEAQGLNLMRWQAVGGRLRILRLETAVAPLSGEASGALALNGGGVPEGEIATAINGLEDLAATLVETGLIGETEAQVFLTTAGLISKSQGGGEAISLPLKFSPKGVYYGPLRLGAVPPLF